MAKRIQQTQLPFGGAEDELKGQQRAARRGSGIPAGQDRRRASRRAPASEPRRSAGPQTESPEVLSVAELDRALRGLLERATRDVCVRGEISGMHRAASGHLYFSLKDEHEDALIECMMFRTAPARARRRMVEGERVVLVGRVSIFTPRGRMQLIAEDVLQTARGALLEALERLKTKLGEEGLFAPERKQPLPPAPRTIAVLTSRDGAAIHDITRVAFRRGRVRILLVPTPVQGAGAAERIARAISLADGLPGVDAIIVTRGGGSLEDLSAYNDELVVRAIAAARRPVVSAVGHEIDVSLSDLVADARAATPSQAAELLVPDHQARQVALDQLRRRLSRAAQHRVATGQERLTRWRARLGEPRRLVFEQAQRFDELTGRLERAQRRRLAGERARVDRMDRRLADQHPRRVLAAARLRLSPLEPRLAAAVRRQMVALRGQLATLTSRLDALSPLAVLSRGYAIAMSETGRVLTGAGQARRGAVVRVRLHRGLLATRVERVESSGEE